MPRLLVLLVFALALAGPSSAQTLREVLERTPADGLAAPLHRLEAQSTRPGEAGEAAFTLGQFHYARGEYRQAADAFGRAAARFEPARKGEARYWQGLAWLGAGDAAQARAALDEVARSDAARRSLARLGLALAWESLQHPERAFDELEALLADRPGEAAPAALAHLEAVAVQLHRDDAADHARERLLREWPASLEAARARSEAAVSVPAPPPASGAVSVQLGAFADPARARALAEAAKRAGFGGAQVVERREAGTVTHLVRLGDYPNADEARKAGERATQLLGVAVRLVKP